MNDIYSSSVEKSLNRKIAIKCTTTIEYKHMRYSWCSYGPQRPGRKLRLQSLHGSPSGPPLWRSLWVGAGISQERSGPSVNPWDARSATVLGFWLPLQEIRVRASRLILVMIYFFSPWGILCQNLESFCVCINIFYPGNLILCWVLWWLRNFVTL